MTMTKKRRRHTPEQIIRKLEEGHRLLAGGMELDEVCRHLEEIHDMAGRKRGASSFVSRSLDIDLLLYGSEVIEARRVPRDDILEYAFVLRPLAELAPDLLHPVTGLTMAEHWKAFDHDAHDLVAVDDIL